MAERQASKASFWLELSYVAMWVCVREDIGSVSGKPESSNDAKRFLNITFIRCHCTGRWVFGCRSTVTDLMSIIPENDTQCWISLRASYISIMSAFRGSDYALPHNSSSYGSGMHKYCRYAEGRAPEVGKSWWSFYTLGNFGECLSLRTEGLCKDHIGTPGCFRTVATGAHAAAM